VHLDYVHDMLGSAYSANVDVVGFLDSTLWIDMLPHAGSQFIGFGETCRLVQSHANVSHLGEDCKAAFAPEEQWKCIMGHYRLAFTRTPYFLVASQADSFAVSANVGGRPQTWAELQYAVLFAAETRGFGNFLEFSPHAFYSPSCYTHANTLTHHGFSVAGCGRDGTTVEQAFNQFLSRTLSGFWEYAAPLQWIDECRGFACGPTCSGLTTEISTTTPAASTVHSISSGSCHSVGCVEMTEPECKTFAEEHGAGFISGSWAPNAADGTPAPDHCYMKPQNGHMFFNRRSSVQEATNIRSKVSHNPSESRAERGLDRCLSLRNADWTPLVVRYVSGLDRCLSLRASGAKCACVHPTLRPTSLRPQSLRPR